MTTENIEGIDDLEAMVGHVVGSVKARRKAIPKEIDGRRRHERNVALTAAASIKRSKDKRAALEEEQEQLGDIDRMADALIDAIDGPEVSEEVPVTPAPIEPPPVADPAPEPILPAPAVVIEPVAVTTTRTPIYRHRFAVWSWGWLQWLLAVSGAFIGLLIANATTGQFDGIVGLGHAILVIVWTIVVTCLGFFAGGFIGSFFDHNE